MALRTARFQPTMARPVINAPVHPASSVTTYPKPSTPLTGPSEVYLPSGGTDPNLLGDIWGGVKKVVGTVLSGGSGPTGPAPPLDIPTMVGGGGAQVTCPPGYQRVGSSCVATSPGAYMPGGQPATMPVSGTQVHGYGNAVIGAWGVPALEPATFSEVRLKCPPGDVLGKDDLCYPKSYIPNRFRKWPKAPKPPVTAGDKKAIQRADRVRNKVKRLAQQEGFHVYETARKTRKKK